MTITSDTSSLFRVKSLLPTAISNSLSRLDKTTLDRISEIRLRKNGVTTLTIDGKNKILTLCGITSEIKKGIHCTSNDIEDFIDHTVVASFRYKYSENVDGWISGGATSETPFISAGMRITF